MPGGFINGGFNIGRSTFPVPFGAFSPAAADYIKRLDSAGVRVARYDAANAALIDRLVGNGGNFWPASGAFCAMAGYLYPGNGANLIPLKDGHDAGTLFNFVTGDWNAVTGLKGDGSTKYVDSNRANNADEQNDQAMGVYATEAATAGGSAFYIGATTGKNIGASQLGIDSGSVFSRSQSNGSNATGSDTSQGFLSITRASSTGYLLRSDGANTSLTLTSQTPDDRNVSVFVRGMSNSFADARLPFYHIGPNLNGAGELAELDAALTEWKNALATA